MRDYYLIRIIYKDIDVYLIWYCSDDEDGVLVHEERLLTFANVEEAKSFAEEQEWLLNEGISLYDLSNITELIDKIELSENCHELINIWNMLSDIAKLINGEFIGVIGDMDEGITLDIYGKLFYGSNLRVLSVGDEEYHPTFDDEEIEKCVSIFNNGLSMLDKQFGIL